RSGVRGIGQAHVREAGRIARACAHLRAVVPAEAPFRPDARDCNEPATRFDLRIDGATDGVTAMETEQTRIEHDLLGDRAVPAAAYFGVHTLRAVENFPITGNSISIYPELIRALACIKEAAARANNEIGLLDTERTEAIVKACREIRDGKLHDQFVVDVIQGGAGTSTNMNANEVIANIELEHIGHKRGDYRQLHTK